jgi:hypothetical protein
MTYGYLQYLLCIYFLTGCCRKARSGTFLPLQMIGDTDANQDFADRTERWQYLPAAAAQQVLFGNQRPDGPRE